MKNKLKTDKYRRSRGGRSKLLHLSCEKCSVFLFDYQKDGPGIIKRLYLDRISNSIKYAGMERSNLKNVPQLVCSDCKQVIGIPIIYKKEDRLAYRIFAGSIIKK